MEKDDEIKAFNTLKILKDIFDRDNINYWLDAGTLLCAYRDGNLFYEHDIDIGVFVEDFPKLFNLRDELNKKFENSLGEFQFASKNTIFYSIGNENIPHCDIIFWFPINGRRFCWGEKLFSVPDHFLSSFTELSFRNIDDKIKFSVPENTLEYIKYYFGDNWHIPITIKENSNNIYPINMDISEIRNFKKKIGNGEFDSSIFFKQEGSE